VIITTTTVLRPFFRDHLGEPVPEENFWTLWCKGRLTEADTLTIRLGATPSGLTSAHLHHPPYFFTGRIPSCHLTDSVKALIITMRINMQCEAISRNAPWQWGKNRRQCSRNCNVYRPCDNCINYVTVSVSLLQCSVVDSTMQHEYCHFIMIFSIILLHARLLTSHCVVTISNDIITQWPDDWEMARNTHW